MLFDDVFSVVSGYLSLLYVYLLQVFDLWLPWRTHVVTWKYSSLFLVKQSLNFNCILTILHFYPLYYIWCFGIVFYLFLFCVSFTHSLHFPGGSEGKESASIAGDLGLVPGLGSSPGEGNGHLLQYSCLENSMEREVWQVTVHGVAESATTERLTLSLPAGWDCGWFAPFGI